MTDATMQALRFYGPGEPLRLEQVPYPVPGEGEAVVRVAACGVCGSDVHIVEGMPLPAPLPIVLGHEAAGVVEALGPGVRDWRRGDRVAIQLGTGCGACASCRAGHDNVCPRLVVAGLHADGAFADAVRVRASCLVRVPDAVTLEAAAVATDCVATPFHALRCRARLAPGERVAIIGLGGLGVVAARLAKLLGAAQVLAVDPSAVALERAARAGADDTFRPAPGDDPASWIESRTDGGADVVLDCVGRPEIIAAGVRALRPGGRLVAIGVGMAPPTIDLPQAMFCVREISVLGSFASHRRDLENVLRLAAAGVLDIDATISHRLPLARAGEGLEMLRTHDGEPQRIVIEVDPARCGALRRAARRARGG